VGRLVCCVPQSREESKKQALAAKREKRKEKRKKKKEEQKRKQEEEDGQKTQEDFSEMLEPKEDSADGNVSLQTLETLVLWVKNERLVTVVCPLSEEEVPIEPPSATTTTTIGISATSTTFPTAFGKKRASVATTPSTNRKNKKNKTKDSPNEPIVLQDPQVSTEAFYPACPLP